MLTSRRLSAAAFRRTRTSPGPGSGSGRPPQRNLSGPPGPSSQTAFTLLLQLQDLGQIDEALLAEAAAGVVQQEAQARVALGHLPHLVDLAHNEDRDRDVALLGLAPEGGFDPLGEPSLGGRRIKRQPDAD